MTFALKDSSIELKMSLELFSTFCSMLMLITYGENGSDVGVAVVSPCGHGPLSLLRIEILLSHYDHSVKVATCH